MFESQTFVIILSLVAGILISGLLYFRNSQFDNPLKAGLFVLRSAAIALLVYVLLAPLFHLKKTEILKPVIAVLVDNSSSMVMHEDSVQIKQNLTAQLQSALADIDNADIQFFAFDDELRTETATFNGPATNIGKAIREVKNRVDEQRLSALFIASDGIANLGVNPLYETENSFLPIYAIGVGDSSRQLDLAITRVDAPEFVFLGDEFVVDATILIKNLNGHETEVTVKLNGTALGRKSIEATSDDYASRTNVVIKPSKAGIYRYSVNVPAVEGEKNVSNNTYTFYVEVIENRKRITILTSSPDPDVAALKESLNKVDAYDVALQNDLESSQLRDETELVIAFFGPKSFARNFNKFLGNYNGPLWLIVSPQANQPQLNRLLPWLNRQAGGAVKEQRPRLNTSFGLFNMSAEAKAFLTSNYKVHAYNGTGNEAGSFDNLVLDNQKRGIVRYGQVENQRVVLFMFSGLWRMRMHDYVQNGSHNSIDEWLQLTAQYLTASGSGNRLRLSYEKRISSSHEQEVFIEVYDAVFQQNTEANITLKLKNESGEVFDFSPVVQGQRYATNLGALQAGEYALEARAKLGSETLFAKGAFISIAQALEARNTQADFTLLQQMASSSGGTFQTMNTINQLSDDLAAAPSVKPIERILDQPVELIDLIWLLFVSAALFAVEWVLRRYFGTI